MILSGFKDSLTFPGVLGTVDTLLVKSPEYLGFTKVLSVVYLVFVILQSLLSFHGT